MRQMISAAKRREYRLFLGLRPWRRHSMVLAVAAVVYATYGFTLITFDSSPSRLRGLQLALDWFGLDVWGWVWILVGIAAFASTRWPPASETWGYSVMSGISALWGAFYFLSIILLDAPLSGLGSCLVWFLIAFLWWGISGLRNPEEIILRDPDKAPPVAPREVTLKHDQEIIIRRPDDPGSKSPEAS